MLVRKSQLIFLSLLFMFSSVYQTSLADTLKELEWEDLIPKEWHPDPDLVFKYNNGQIGDADPRILALRKKLAEMERLAPTNKRLDGKRIKLPGFALPLETDGKTVSEFLLLPYHGACIHVPPPPANQIVLVKLKKGTKVVKENFDTVLVTGIMRIEKNKSEVAESGYTLTAEKVEAYQ
ncbi:MAG: DUF3299 domain-containing protein [Gammaproteobacteria bacterium]|nr:DUF3299 domain-containing protein [Gammaproteobacteria bacterium]